MNKAVAQKFFQTKEMCNTGNTSLLVITIPPWDRTTGNSLVFWRSFQAFNLYNIITYICTHTCMHIDRYVFMYTYKYVGVCIHFIHIYLVYIILIPTYESWKYKKKKLALKKSLGASLVAQWLRILLPVQGTRVRALVQEDPTCRGATKPMRHNYWACALEPTRHNYWARVPQLLKPTCLEPELRNKRSHRNEKPTHCNKECPRSLQLEKPCA